MASRRLIRVSGCILFVLLLLGAGTAFAAEKQWFKGNLHCHSIWSDGNCPPDYVVDWYKSRGYNFLALTDHNVFAEKEQWAPVVAQRKKGSIIQKVYEAYKQRFGAQGIAEKTEAGKTLVRLKTYKELAAQFNEPGKFLLIPGEEITCPDPKGTNYRVHVVAANITGQIEAPKAAEDMKNPNTWQANTAGELVAAQSKTAGRPMHAHLNHPLWSHFETEQVCLVKNLNQMELNNDDSGSSSALVQTAKLWDTVIDYRIKHQLPLMLGMAVDDAHNHLNELGKPYDAGHGWIMVHAASLAPEDLVKAIDAGDFYATRGPVLSEIKCGKDAMALTIAPADGVTYTTEFIGERNGGQPGEILATSTDLSPVYKLKGDEVYVRAKVTSSKARFNDKGQPEYLEMAWTQPYQPGK